MVSQYTATFVELISVPYEFNLTCIITFSILFKGFVCLWSFCLDFSYQLSDFWELVIFVIVITLDSSRLSSASFGFGVLFYREFLILCKYSLVCCLNILNCN